MADRHSARAWRGRARLVLVGALGAAALVAPAVAHHSYAMFNRAKEITLTGTVRKLLWQNPHAAMWINLATPAGDLWAIEMPGPTQLIQRGWKRDDIKEGDKIVVVANPLRDGRSGGQLVSARLANGKTLNAGDVVLDTGGPGGH